MDLKALLEKFDQFAGQAVGQKPGDQVRGTEKTNPTKSGKDHPFKGRLVGGGAEQQEESVLKDLSKGLTPKTREQELAEEYQAFLEAEFKDTVDRRPARKNARPARGHKEQPRYTTIKADEGYDTRDAYELEDPKHPDFRKNYEEYKEKHPDAKLADFIAHLRSRKAKTDEAANPAQQAAIAIAMKKAGKKPKNEGVAYKAANPHPASKDPIVAKVLKQMRPGLTGLEMNNEAFLYFAYELGKQRAREMWEDYGPAIKYFYQSGIGVNEGWESGPEEYKEPYDDADDAYDRQRQEKIDTEAEKEWAKLPKVSTYKLTGRGPNMEPNYEFGDEFDSLEQALKYREEIMKDPKTPYPEHIGIRTITRVINKEQTDEAVDSDIVQAMGQDAFNRAGYNPIRDERDYLKRLSDLSNLSRQPGLNQQMKDHIKQRILDLNAEARAKKYIQAESRGHEILSTKLKDIERAKKFASGELKIPTPQERQAQLAKQEPKKEKVDEYGADNVSPYGQPTTPKVDLKQAQQAAANLNIQKTALNQLKQINPEINPQKAATAMTKDTATMSPQEKEELAQVAKTVSPALGTPAFGSIKTAIQKSQIQAKK